MKFLSIIILLISFISPVHLFAAQDKNSVKIKLVNRLENIELGMNHRYLGTVEVGSNHENGYQLILTSDHQSKLTLKHTLGIEEPDYINYYISIEKGEGTFGADTLSNLTNLQIGPEPVTIRFDQNISGPTDGEFILKIWAEPKEILWDGTFLDQLTVVIADLD